MNASKDFRNTKICDLKLAVFCDEEIFELNIAVCNAVTVEIIEAGRANDPVW
jgi:hypothetical protein